jgi:hypothetical protein
MGRVNKRVLAMAGAAALALLACSGCASKYVQASVRNQTSGAVTLVEVDYPSASFGTETLAASAEYNYRFKILGSGPTKVLWTDASHKQHEVAGPKLEEGQQGTLVVTLTQTDASWDTKLTH